MLGISTLVSDYSQQIEKLLFDTLFKKIEPNSSWSAATHMAWSVVTDSTLEDAETAAHVIARSWLNSEIQSWDGKVEKDAKMQNLRDADNNLIVCLKPSKSPLIW